MESVVAKTARMENFYAEFFFFCAEIFPFSSKNKNFVPSFHKLFEEIAAKKLSASPSQQRISVSNEENTHNKTNSERI
jgi:hypothetical protein